MILLVEDEPNVAEALCRFLTAEGLLVRPAVDAAGAEREVQAQMPELVLLDWALPDRPGIELLRGWRERGLKFPVIMLTARAELIDKVLGLELGADDYVTKPFEPRELLARIRARLRSASEPARTSLTAASGALVIDTAAHEVRWRGVLVELTRMEFGLLRLLVEERNKVFSRDELLNRVWGFEAFPTTRTVDTHMLQLRQKLAAEIFETVRGVGYRFRDVPVPPKN